MYELVVTELQEFSGTYMYDSYLVCGSHKNHKKYNVCL